MCLATIKSAKAAPRSWGYDWKVFTRAKSGRLYGWMYSPKGVTDYSHHPNNCYNVGTKYEAQALRSFLQYPAGFHVYQNRKDAEERAGGDDKTQVVRRVRWSHRLAVGKQNRRGDKGLCVVAKYMTILPEKGDAKPRKKDKR